MITEKIFYNKSLVQLFKLYYIFYESLSKY